MKSKYNPMHIFNLIPPFITSPETVHQPVYIKSCLVITSSTSSISRFNRFISTLKTSWQLKEEEFDNITISVYEALMNAIVHGNKCLSGRLIYISALRNGDSYIFTIEDEGNGFDYEAVQHSFCTEDLFKTGGRGIFIMQHLADAVRFLKNGKCVQLLFNSR